MKRPALSCPIKLMENILHAWIDILRRQAHARSNANARSVLKCRAGSAAGASVAGIVFCCKSLALSMSDFA